MRETLHFRQGVLTLLLFLFTFSSFAQTGTVRGQVKDASGGALSGASVQLPGAGAITDANGQYQLSVTPGSYTLSISYVGYGTQRIPITVVAGETLQQDITLAATGALYAVTVIGSRNASRTRVETPVRVDVIPIS